MKEKAVEGDLKSLMFMAQHEGNKFEYWRLFKEDKKRYRIDAVSF